MSESTKHLGHGVTCGYCGEYTLGVELSTVQVVDLEEIRSYETIVIDPNRDLRTQILEHLDIPNPETHVQCPSCEETSPEEYGDIEVGDLYQCIECESVYTDETDADVCCDWQRRRARDQASQEIYKLAEARRILEQSGYQVIPTTANQSVNF